MSDVQLFTSPSAVPPRAAAGALDMRPLYVGIADAARLASLSTTSINVALKVGELTRFKVGARTLIRVAELDGWIASKAERNNS